MNEEKTFENRPVTMNPKKNLLEIEEHMYILDDVEKPNVFRNMFPYSDIPKIPFNDRIVPHNMPRDIWITDTTFRDGQQSTLLRHRPLSGERSTHSPRFETLCRLLCP